MLEKFGTGHYVLVTLFGQKSYVGKVSFISNSFDRMEIINAVHITSFTTIEKLKCYESEISSIKQLDSKPKEVVTCEFILQEWLEIGDLLKNYIFIERFDVKYHNAIAELRRQSSIGLYVAGAEKGRFSTASLIVISTDVKIYIFDIMILGRIENQLKNILEANAPKKIIHNSDRVADNLKHKYNIDLNGVFDTMIAHVSLGFNKTRSSLQECLSDHFKVPVDFMEKTIESWHQRPLTFIQKDKAAQNVVFLRKMQNYFTKLMLAKIYSASEN